jgi:hypothetical protein
MNRIYDIAMYLRKITNKEKRELKTRQNLGTQRKQTIADRK